MSPAKIRSYNGRKPLLRGGGNGFQILRKVFSVSVLQQKEIGATEIDVTRVLKAPKKRHFWNLLHLQAYETLHNLFCSKNMGLACRFFHGRG
jgi:hypothetical protein